MAQLPFSSSNREVLGHVFILLAQQTCSSHSRNTQRLLFLEMVLIHNPGSSLRVYYTQGIMGVRYKRVADMKDGVPNVTCATIE